MPIASFLIIFMFFNLFSGFQKMRTVFIIFFSILFRGTFRMEREDGYSFECRIPPFALESKQDDPDDPAIIGN